MITPYDEPEQHYIVVPGTVRCVNCGEFNPTCTCTPVEEWEEA